MFLAVLLPILEPPVPPDLRTPRPQSPRLAEQRFVESPLFISNILECHFSPSSTVRSLRSKLKRIARTSRPKGLSHPPPPSCHKNPRICRNFLAQFSNFLECRFSFCPRRLHRSWMSLSTAPFVPGDCAARLHSSPAKSGVVEIPFLIFQFIGMPFPSLLPSTLSHEDSSCAAYAFQCSQPNTRKVVSCRRFSIVISSIPESLLPLLKSAVPYVSATSQPRSPRRIDSPFVEILPGVFYLPGIVSEPVLPAPQRIEFVVFAANVLSTRHSHALKVVSCRHLRLPLSIFLE